MITKNEKRSMAFDRLLSWCGDSGSRDESLMDLLADARHWCDRNHQSFAELDRRAYQHYLAEIHPVSGDEP